MDIHFSARQKSIDSVVGWGLKPLSKFLKLVASLTRSEYLTAEDGFLCYLGHPCKGASRMGLILDSSGIYYDSRNPSDLEAYVIQRSQSHIIESDLKVVRSYIKCLVDNGVGKYFERRGGSSASSDYSGCVVLVEQIFGDCSMKYGQCSNVTADEVIRYALKLADGRPVLFKNHPDLVNEKKGKVGFFSKASKSLLEKLVYLDPCVKNNDVLALASDVVTLTSQFGFEALLARKNVHCFGQPFYSGWGLTVDVHESEKLVDRRGSICQPTLEDLFLAAYSDYTTYVSPKTGKQIKLNEMLKILTGQEMPTCGAI
ncbi:hypothetical protein KJB35_04980 [Vibrio sp. D431a]|nr:hypothetical protein [Vibrio sp. D431a]